MMLRLSAVAVLIVTIFVERVCPAPHEVGYNSTTVETTTNGKGTSDILTKNAMETTRPPVKRPDNKTEELLKFNETSSVEPAESLLPVNKTSVEKEQLNEKSDCNYEKEQDNMVHCVVTPHDDEDIDDDENLSLNTTESTTSTIAASKEASLDNVQINVTKEPPKYNWLNKTVYDTVAAEKDDPKNTSVTEASHIDAKHGNNETDVPVSSVAPLLVDSVRSIEAESIREPAKSSDTSDKKSMPSGIIALVTAITFAILIVIGYVSMVAWRRYLEYRYGHRELLVNDLEFDTNDLRHFEL